MEDTDTLRKLIDQLIKIIIESIKGNKLREGKTKFYSYIRRRVRSDRHRVKNHRIAQS